MNIGEIASRSGVPPKTIRYYEEVGLVRPAERSGNGYRTYSDRDLQILRFIGRARSLGFSMQDCRNLLELYLDRDRASADVKTVALQRVTDIDRKLEQLRTMRAVLVHLAERCHGDMRPDCPILDDLAGEDDLAGGDDRP